MEFCDFVGPEYPESCKVKLNEIICVNVTHQYSTFSVKREVISKDLFKVQLIICHIKLCIQLTESV